MPHCMQCNAMMRRDEEVCYACNARVPDHNPKKTMAQHFSTVLTIMIVIVGLITIGSMFTDVFPSFTKCVAILCVLVLVKKSADTMSEFRKDL